MTGSPFPVSCFLFSILIYRQFRKRVSRWGGCAGARWIPAFGTVDKHTLALRRAQGERKNLSECRPSTAQDEPVEAGFAHLSTAAFAGMTKWGSGKATPNRRAVRGGTSGPERNPFFA